MCRHLPEGIFWISTLEFLQLHNNHIRHNVPSIINHLSSLKKLDLSINHLTDTISAETAELSEFNNIYSLNLSNNYLIGTAFDTLNDLTSLIHLDVSHNSFQGKTLLGRINKLDK